MCCNTKPRALFTTLLHSDGRIRLLNNIHLMRIWTETTGQRAAVQLRQEQFCSRLQCGFSIILIGLLLGHFSVRLEVEFRAQRRLVDK